MYTPAKLATSIIAAIVLSCSLLSAQSVPASGPNDPRNSSFLNSYDWTAPLNWPLDATKFLRGDRTWAALPASAVTSVFGRSGAVVAVSGDYSDALISFTDITTNNASSTKHGFLPKLPADATKYLDGSGAFSVPAGGSSVITQAKVTLSSAQLKALRATPVTLVAAPGVNKSLHVVGFFTSYVAGATPYTVPVAANFKICINCAVGDFSFNMVLSGFIDQAASQIQSLTQTSNFFGPTTDASNQALVITLTGGIGELTLGDGTVIVTILYAVIDLT